MARTKAKTELDFALKCSGSEGAVGVTDPTTVNDAAVQKDLNLIHDIFGPDLDASIVREASDKTTARCQQKVASTVKKCQDVKLREFNKCKKAGLRKGVIVTPAGIEACIFPDPRGKIARACIDKVQQQVEKRCVGKDVDLLTAQLPTRTSESWARANATSLILQGFFEFVIVGCSQRVPWGGWRDGGFPFASPRLRSPDP